MIGVDRRSEFSPSRDEQVQMLGAAAATLRRLLGNRVADEAPHEFMFMSVAHLLEELARSVGSGQEPSEQTIHAALEIARHLRHRNP